MLYEMRREWPIVEERAVGAMKSAGEHGFALVLAAGQILQGAATAAGGQPAEGSRQIRDGLDAYLATGALIQRPHHLVMLAEALGAEGLPGEGLEALKDAADLAEATGERYYEAEIHRLKGELLLAASPQASTEAEACFRQALDAARSQEAKSLELRAANSLACLWRTQGKSAKAHELLAEIYDWFTEGHDTLDLKKAKRTLDDLKTVTTA
jgi:predicted ATPase